MRKLKAKARLSLEKDNQEILTEMDSAQWSNISAEMRLVRTNSDSMTIPILIKLLLINMVASNFLGLSFKTRMRWLLPELSCCSFSKSFGVNEKKATSEPETRAEHSNKSRIANIPRKTSDGGIANSRDKLSESKTSLPGSVSNESVIKCNNRQGRGGIQQLRPEDYRGRPFLLRMVNHHLPHRRKQELLRRRKLIPRMKS